MPHTWQYRVVTWYLRPRVAGVAEVESQAEEGEGGPEDGGEEEEEGGEEREEGPGTQDHAGQQGYCHQGGANPHVGPRDPTDLQPGPSPHHSVTTGTEPRVCREGPEEPRF